MQTRALGVGCFYTCRSPGAVGPFPGGPDSSPVVRVPRGNAPDLLGHGQFTDVLVDFRIAPPAALMGADMAGPADHNAGFERYRRAHDIWNDVVSFGTFPQWMAGSTFAAGVADAGLVRGASVLLPSERLSLNRGRKSRMRLSSRHICSRKRTGSGRSVPTERYLRCPQSPPRESSGARSGVPGRFRARHRLALEVRFRAKCPSHVLAHSAFRPVRL